MNGSILMNLLRGSIKNQHLHSTFKISHFIGKKCDQQTNKQCPYSYRFLCSSIKNQHLHSTFKISHFIGKKCDQQTNKQCLYLYRFLCSSQTDRIYWFFTYSQPEYMCIRKLEYTCYRRKIISHKQTNKWTVTLFI